MSQRNDAIDLARCADFMLGDLLVRPSQRSIEANGAQLSLEPRVMQVLVALSERVNNAVSRDELMQRCWNGAVVGDDALQRCIVRLRRFAEDHGGFSIDTVSKIGYRLLGEVRSGIDESDDSHSSHAAGPPVLLFARAQSRSRNADDQAFLSLLAEDVTVALSLNPDVWVINRPIDADQQDPVALGEALGANFILGAELRRAGTQMRCIVTLTDVSSRRIVDSFTLHAEAPDDGIPDDTLVFDIANRAYEAVRRDAMGKALTKDTDLSAWEAVIRSHSAYMHINIDSLRFATEEARRAVAIDGRYAAAHAALANALGALFELEGGTDTGRAAEARKHCDQALALDANDPTILTWTGHTLGMITRPPEGQHLLERAIAIAPAHPIAHLYLMRHHVYAGRAEDALASLDYHERVAPHFPWRYFLSMYRGIIQFMLGDMDSALALFKRSTEENPDYPYSWIARVLTASLAGDAGDARSSTQALKTREGEDSLQRQLERVRHSYPDTALADSLCDSLTQAWESY